jgi:hypothetical protein
MDRRVRLGRDHGSDPYRPNSSRSNAGNLPAKLAFIGRDMMVRVPEFLRRESRSSKSSILVTRDSGAPGRVCSPSNPPAATSWPGRRTQTGRSPVTRRFVWFGISFTPASSPCSADRKSARRPGDRLLPRRSAVQGLERFIFVNFDAGRRTLGQYLGEHLWNGFDASFEKMTERYGCARKANGKG